MKQVLLLFALEVDKEKLKVNDKRKNTSSWG